MRGCSEVLKSCVLPDTEPMLPHHRMSIEIYDLEFGRSGNAKEPCKYERSYDWTVIDKKPSEVASMLIASYELEGIHMKSKIEIDTNRNWATIKMLRTNNPVIKNAIQVAIN